MINRWVWFVLCVLLGLLLLAGGLLVPAHLRALDAGVLEQAGRDSRSVVADGLALVEANRLGAADLLAQAARQEQLPGQEQLDAAVGKLAAQHPGWQRWGGGDTWFGPFYHIDARATNSTAEPFTDFMVRQGNRSRTLESLRASEQPLARELLRFREVTNTVIFSPSESAAGQALDTAIAITGILAERGHLTAELKNQILAAATQAHGGNSEGLENELLDLMSLGQRFNWGQLVEFVRPMTDTETLRFAADAVRNAGEQLPLVYAAAHVSGKPGQVGKYLRHFPETGGKDLGLSLRGGAGGVDELLQRDRQLYHAQWMSAVPKWVPREALAGLVWRQPWVALALKWLLYLGSGFLLALALHCARPRVSDLERPLQVRGFHAAREFLFSLGFLLVVLLLSEPFLAQDSHGTEMPLRLHLPTSGGTAAAESTGAHATIMNQLSLLTLLLFFVLQGLIYVACLVKLAEIRRQQVSARMKLKLLENEEHLFDAGLYLGFVGTIISLIMVSLGVIKPSLMAAYSSTSFGIIFVSIFKIFHLRPRKRILLMEAEQTHLERTMPAAAPSLAAPL